MTLTDEQVQQLRARRRAGATYAELASEFKISARTAESICLGYRRMFPGNERSARKDQR